MRRLTTVVSVVSALALAASLLALPTPAPAEAQTTSFADTAGHVHRDNIERLAERGVTRGCAEGLFCPEAPVTRQEMATFLARALELPAGSSSSRFVDVTNPTHGPNVEAIASLDPPITTGVTGRCTVPTQREGEPEPAGDRFCPLDPITRNQMAVFLQRAFGLTSAQPVGLTDLAQSAGIHVPAIGAALQAGVTQGCLGGDRYCGGEQVKRGQMASFLMRALDAVGRRTACPRQTDRGTELLEVATRGFPVNSATADAARDRLYLFTNGLSPQRLVVVRLSDGDVLRNHVLPGNGTRVWASAVAGDHLYIGRWGTGTAHSFQRVPLASLGSGAETLSPQDIGMEGLGGATPLDDRIRGNDGQPSSNREFWALTSDDQGRVYAGTGRQETVYRFTPPEVTGDASGLLEAATLTGLPPLPANSKREITALAWTPSGLVVGTGRGQGLARIVDTTTLDPTVGQPPASGGPVERTWASRQLSLGSGTSGIFGIYGAHVALPTEAAPGRVLLTTEEERARLVEVTIPQLPATGTPAPLPGSSTSRRAPVDEPFLSRPGTSPSGTAVAVGSSTTTLYEANASLVDRGRPVPASLTRWLDTVDGEAGTALVGVTANGTVWRRPTTQSETTIRTLESQSGVTRGPERPQSLTATRVGPSPDNAPAFAVVGGNNKATVHALAPGAGWPRDVTMPGEVKTVVADGGRVYAATYPGGELRRFTIEGNSVSQADLFVSWPDVYNRPRDIAYDARNARVVVGAKADFAGYGAIISVDVTGNATPEQRVQRVSPMDAVLPGPASTEPLTVAIAPDGTAVIGTPNGYVVGFDHVNGRKRWEIRPTTGRVSGLTVTADGAVHGLTASGVRFRIVDPLRGVATVTATSALLQGAGAGTPGELSQVDGQLVAATTTRLVAIDPATGAERLLSEGRAPLTFAERAHAAAVPGSGCQDVLTYRAQPSGSADAWVTRVPVVRP